MTTMTGRRENPLPPDGDLTPLADRLRRHRQAAGNPPYRDMGATVSYSAPALSQAANGRKLPSLEVVQAYLAACQVTDENAIAEVRALWETAKATQRKSKEPKSARDVTGDDDTATDDPAVQQPNAVDPARLLDFDMFADGLVRVRAGLSVRELIERSQAAAPATDGADATAGRIMQLKKSTVYDVLNKKIRPSVEFTRIYLRACGLTEDKIKPWITTLKTLHDDARRVATAFKALTGRTSIAIGDSTFANLTNLGLWPVESMEVHLPEPLPPSPSPKPRTVRADQPTMLYRPHHRRRPPLISLEWNGSDKDVKLHIRHDAIFLIVMLAAAVMALIGMLSSG